LATDGRYPPSLRRALYRLGLADNIVPAGGAYKRPAMRVAPYYEQFGVQFTWDLPYSARAVATVGRRPDLARGFVENMLDLQQQDGPDRGMVPRHMHRDGHMAGQDGSQVPLLAWLAMEIDAVERDDGFLRRVKPRLAAHLDWWQSPRRDVDGDGLSEYAGSTPTFVAYESGHDFSPERDLVMGEPAPPGADGLVHEPIADVFLNSCLHAELDAMARIAERVAPAEAPGWAERRDRLAARVREAMWDAEVGGFFPAVRRDLCDAQPRHVRHTPAMLMPLWAGIATERQAAETLDTLRGRRRGYPHWDGAMTLRFGPHLYHGCQVVTDGLHPARDGIERDGDTVVLRFGEDRKPAHAPLRLRSSLPATVVDGRGEPHDVHDAAVWVHGIREVRCSLRGGDELTLRWSRMHHEGLLSPYGVKSAHPLDGKHPAPGAPTELWSGTVWAPHQFHACHALLRHGEVDLALACARAFCDAVATSYAAVALMLIQELLDRDVA
jgi:glycogen debranching enzyme